MCLCTRNRWKLGDEGDASGSGSRIFHDVHVLLTRQMEHSREFKLSNCFPSYYLRHFWQRYCFQHRLFVCLFVSRITQKVIAYRWIW